MNNRKAHRNIYTAFQLFKSVKSICETIHTLLQDSAINESDINWYSPEGETLVIEALNSRNQLRNILELAFNLGADPEKPKLHFVSDTHPETPLSSAALGKDLAMIDLLHKELHYKYDYLYKTGQIPTNQPANISVNESVAPKNINLKDLAQKLQPKTPASPKPSKPATPANFTPSAKTSNVVNFNDYKNKLNQPQNNL